MRDIQTQALDDIASTTSAIHHDIAQLVDVLTKLVEALQEREEKDEVEKGSGQAD